MSAFLLIRRLLRSFARENAIPPISTWRWNTILQELALTLLAIISMFLVITWMLVLQQISDSRLHPRNRHPLNDLGFDLLPHIHHVNAAIDSVVDSAGVLAVLGNTVLAAGWRMRVVFLRRIAWMVAILYFLRSLTLVVTTLPTPLVECEPTYHRGWAGYLNGAWDQITGRRLTCTDCIFSGHSMTLTLSFLMWLHHARHWLFVAIAFAQTTVGLFLIIASHFHYSIDVLLAVVLTLFVYYCYLTSLERAANAWIAQGVVQGKTRGHEGADTLDTISVPLRVPDDSHCTGLESAEAYSAPSSSLRTSFGYTQLPCPPSTLGQLADACLPCDFSPLVSRSDYLVAIGVRRLPIMIRLYHVVAWIDGLHLRWSPLQYRHSHTYILYQDSLALQTRNRTHDPIGVETKRTENDAETESDASTCPRVTSLPVHTYINAPSAVGITGRHTRRASEVSHIDIDIVDGDRPNDR